MRWQATPTAMFYIASMNAWRNIISIWWSQDPCLYPGRYGLKGQSLVSLLITKVVRISGFSSLFPANEVFLYPLTNVLKTLGSLGKQEKLRNLVRKRLTRKGTTQVPGRYGLKGQKRDNSSTPQLRETRHWCRILGGPVLRATTRLSQR